MRRPSNLMKSITAPEPARPPADPGPPTNYLDLYGLSKPPFASATDQAGYIVFGAQRRAFELLTDHLVSGSGVIVLLAEEGAGKTETLRAAAAVAAESGRQTIMVSRPTNGRVSLSQLVSALRGEPSAEPFGIGDLVKGFEQSPRKALIADDVQLMPNDCIGLLLTLARAKTGDAGRDGGSGDARSSDAQSGDAQSGDAQSQGPGSDDPRADGKPPDDLKPGDPKPDDHKLEDTAPDAPQPRDLKPGDPKPGASTTGDRAANPPIGPAIILSTATDLAADPARPDLTQLVGLARNTVRLSRLGPAEVRQYIERSLWISGGTTRRLITADAMKLLIARSEGLPGTVNRLMEAAFTAGFARGDTMITAKTVAAAVGPTAPRRPPRTTAESLSTAGRALQLVASLLLVTGASVFLYKALNTPTRHPSTSAEKPALPQPHPSPPSASAAVDPAAAVRPADSLPPPVVAALLKRGGESLDLGDIVAARLLFQRAAAAGSAPAAIALGKTYDPNYAATANSRDAARAAEWYQKAALLGDSRAIDLLKRLGAR